MPTSLMPTSVMQRRLLALSLTLCCGWAQAAPEADKSLQDIPMPAVAAAASCPPKATLPSRDEMKAMARAAQDRGLLWRVSNGGRESWLYGTSHVGRRTWLVPGRTVLEAMGKADKLALELNVMDPEVVKGIAQGMKARDDAPELEAALAARLQVQRDKACAQDIAMLRPDAQVIALQAMSARSQGVYPDYGVDMLLAGMAAGLKKPVVSLETPELQIRELFSDDGEIILKFRHSVGICGISNVATRPDLMDRAILVELGRLDESERRTEAEIEREFERVRPGILHDLFTTIAKSRTILPTIKDRNLPRMADCARWGAAIAEALGIGADRFFDDLAANGATVAAAGTCSTSCVAPTRCGPRPSSGPRARTA